MRSSLKASGTNERHSSFGTGKVFNSLYNATGPAVPTYVCYCGEVCYKNYKNYDPKQQHTHTHTHTHTEHTGIVNYNYIVCVRKL